MIRSILKHAAAVLLGVLILDAFCALYYNPAPYEWTEDRATDKVRRPGAWTSQAKEGAGIHRMDANGYNNPTDAADGAIAILMMGSSHTEGFNVPAGENAARRLEALWQAGGRSGRAYNIGISSHTFPHNAANLPRALARFAPSDYVIIETDSVMFSRTVIDAAMADDMPRLRATDVPLPAIVSDRPLVKQLYKQYKALKYKRADDEDDGAAAAQDLPELSPELQKAYRVALAAWFAKMRSQAEAAGTTLIIYYHPRLTPNMDGSLAFHTSQTCLDAFSAACADAGVIFVDMTQPFADAYQTAHILPNGFANTAMGEGHLNRDGHRLVAEALYRAIIEAEGGKA